MNPNFLNNFTPEQIEQTRKMMNPEMMKTASNMFQNMSDDQIQGYLNMMGMSGMSPQQFRQMSSSLGNLTPEQIEAMKNQKIPSYYPNTYSNYQPPQTAPKDPDKRGTFIDNLNSIKNDGNAYFRQKYYKSACDKYYEILNEIKTAPDMTKNAFQKEIEDMERIVRLNIAACKLQQGEYDCVISECLIVLEKHKCFKAYYRMGVAWYSKGKYEKALKYLEEGEKMANSNEKADIDKYLKLCKEEIKKKEEEEEQKKQKEKEEQERKEKEEQERKEKEERERKEKEENETKEKETIVKEDNCKVDSKEEQNKEETIHSDTKPKETKDKLSSMENLINKEKEQLSHTSTSSQHKENDIDNDDIKVESTSPSNNTPPPFMPQQPPLTGMPPNMPHNPNDYLSKLNDIPDSQLNSMMDMIKSMDNASLKNMLQSQGMNLDDQQISMLKSTMNMDTFNMLRSPQFQQNFGSYMNSPPSQPLSTQTQSTTPTSNTTSQHPSNPSPPGGAPGAFPNLQNFDLKSMLQFLKSNPEMLKAISPQFEKMFGNNKLDPQTMISMLEKTLWITEVPGRIKRFMFSWRGVCLLMIIIAIILAWKY